MKDSAHKIRTLSQVLKVIFLIAACALPVLNAGAWITEGYAFLKPWAQWTLTPGVMENVVKPIDELPSHIRLLGFLISLIPIGFQTVACAFLMRLFGMFEKLEFFTQASVLYIRKLGFCLLLGQLTYPFYIALLSLALTFTNPPGQRMVSMAFGAEQMTLTVIALIIILISWIMNEGRKLQDEQAATI